MLSRASRPFGVVVLCRLQAQAGLSVVLTGVRSNCSLSFWVWL